MSTKQAKKAKGTKPKAKKVTAVLAAPNATRAAEIAQAKAEGKKKAKAAKRPASERPLGKRAQAEANAKAGKLPPPPDFSAKTHERYRPKLDEMLKLVKAKDVKALKAIEINPISTSPRALARYRDLAVTALQASA